MECFSWTELKVKLDELKDIKFQLLTFSEKASATISEIEEKDELIEQFFLYLHLYGVLSQNGENKQGSLPW